MTWIVAVLYFVPGYIAFIKKIKLFAIVSSLLFAFALISVSDSLLLQSIYIAIVVITFICLLAVNTRSKNKGTIYFSLPCWLFIASVLINVFLTP